MKVIRFCIIWKPFYADLLEKNMEKQSARMDEQGVQEVKTVSREIVEKEFPDEEEYFDFLFDLVIPELQETEPGKEAEFLREIRAVHPLALGCTTVVITVAFQVLSKYTYRDIDSEDEYDSILAEDVQRIISGIVGDENDQEEFSKVPDFLIKNIKKARERTKKDQSE
jgi:hypothetical protein